MKPHTSVLLEAAENDLLAARRALPDDPPTASYHAQQCAEKAVKAAAFELGDFRDARQFEPIAKRIGHDSTGACLQVIKDMVMRAWRESGFEHQHAQYRRMMMKGQNPRAAIAYQLGERYRVAYQKSLELFGTPAVVLDDAVWRQSLDPDLKPEAQVKEKWQKGADEAHEISDEVWISLIKELKIDSPRAFKLMDRSTSLQEKVDIVNEIAQERQGKGLTSQAEGLKSAGAKLQHMFGPNSELESWLVLVVSWGPFLDVHEQLGRYYDGAHLDGYQKNVKGVEHLVNKAEEILTKTKILLSVLAGA